MTIVAEACNTAGPIDEAGHLVEARLIRCGDIERTRKTGHVALSVVGVAAIGRRGTRQSPLRVVGEGFDLHGVGRLGHGPIAVGLIARGVAARVGEAAGPDAIGRIRSTVQCVRMGCKLPTRVVRQGSLVTRWISDGSEQMRGAVVIPCDAAQWIGDAGQIPGRIVRQLILAAGRIGHPRHKSIGPVGQRPGAAVGVGDAIETCGGAPDTRGKRDTVRLVGQNVGVTIAILHPGQPAQGVEDLFVAILARPQPGTVGALLKGLVVAGRGRVGAVGLPRVHQILSIALEDGYGIRTVYQQSVIAADPVKAERPHIAAAHLDGAID